MTVHPSQHLIDAMLRLDFPSFIARAMAELEPGTRYEENWHVLHLAHKLEQVRSGDIRRLMINQPPRSLKTMTTSICYVAWLLGHDPTRKVMCLTYSNDVARIQAELFNRLVRSRWYRRIFPKHQPAVPNRILDYRTSVGGGRLATSIQGSVLGLGADLIILDDPNKGQEIYSKVARDKVKSAYDQVISTRLIHPMESAIICMMQRLHQDDLAGHMLEQEEWQQVIIPAIAIEDETWELGRGRIHRREAGELLQPARADAAWYAQQRRNKGTTTFEAQYQQRPIPQDGVVIRRAWLRYYDVEPSELDFILASWDTASTLSEKADWSAGTIWGVAGGNIYLLHVERERLESPDLRHRIEAIHSRFHADVTIIEDAGLGRGIVQDLRRTSPTCLPIAIPVRIEKIARMQARAVMFETGKVFLPEAAEWLPAYLEEMLGFPNNRHDDQVDSTSQALDFLQQRFAEYPARRQERKRPAGNVRPRGARQRRS
jgi:predicted phage terminase large subunit-like protein